MTTSKVTPRALASLKLPRANLALINCAQAMVKGMTGNPSFTTPAPTLAAVSAAIADLVTAENAALTRLKGTAAARNEKRAILVSLLQQLRSYVQGIADLSPENGASIIQSAGLVLRKVPTRGPRVFAAKPGALSGQVKLVAPSAGHRSSYEWESSTDGGKTWVAQAPTIQAKTIVTGLAMGSSVQFRYRTVTKTGASDWSLPITIPQVQ